MKDNPIQSLAEIPENYFSMTDAEKQEWATAFLTRLYQKIEYISPEGDDAK